MTPQQKETLFKLINSRDPRYDGRFYFGVKTTKIYCRPTCPAKPFKKNVIFFKSKAEAENEGYRPCLRCRPDVSPFSPMWEGSAAVVSRALKIISTQNSEDFSIEELANKLGITDRHLRRLFDEHLGASPLEVAISNRLHVARQFLTETRLPVIDIAMASGFNSLRRFNDAFLKKYKRPPRDFRKETSPSNSKEETIHIKLSYLPPYDWNSIYNFLKKHSVYGSEVFEEDTYKRILKIDNRYIEVHIQNNGIKNYLSVSIQNAKVTDLKPIITKIKNLFDLEPNPLSIEIPKSRVKLEGLRIPGSMDGFETAITIILGQVVSTEQAAKNVKKLVENFGEKLLNESPFTFLFPTPEVLAKSDLSILKLTKSRTQAIQEFSRRVASGDICFYKHTDIAEVKTKLLEIKGIGPWTTEMIALRCLGDTDAFPNKDLIVLRAIKNLNLKSEKYSPWRGYLTLWIWKHYAIRFSNKKHQELVL